MPNNNTNRLDLNLVIKLFFSFSLGVWVQAIINFFSVPVITFLISPAEFGKATMYSTLYSLLLLVVLAGSDQSYVRFYYEMEKDKRSQLLWTCLLTPILIFIVVSSFLIIFSGKLSLVVVGEPGHSIGVLVSLSLFSGILQVFNLTSIRMQKKGFLYSAVFIVQSLVNVSGTIVYAIFFGRSFYAIVYGQILSNFIAFLVGFAFEHSHIFPVKIDHQLLKSVISYGLPLLPSAFLWWLFTWLSRISLRMFSDFVELGYFSAAFKLSYVLYMIYSGFQNFWLPVAYETYEKDRENKNFFADTAGLITFVMALFALLVVAFKDIIFLIMAKEYAPASRVLPFLLLSPVILAVLTVTARGINFAKKTYWFILSDAICVIVNFAGNMVLIPLLGARGAAISTGISFVVLFATETHISKKLFPVKYPLSKIYLTFLFLILDFAVATFIEKSLVVYVFTTINIIAVCLLNLDWIKRGVRLTLSSIRTKSFWLS
ncbi:MAG: oligosaccharide flippase family protein [candidate division WOR-3 bacterium]